MTGNQNQDKQDVFAVCQEGADKVFSHVKQTVPQFHQSITNLQQEYLQACEDACGSVIAIQKEYADKTDFKPFVSATVLKGYHNSVEEFAKLANIRTQFALATIDATQQGIKTMHDNVKLFTELNKNFVLPWSTLFLKKN